MISTMAEEARDLGATLETLLQRAGGVEMTRRHLERPTARGLDLVDQVGALGVWDLDPAGSQVELEASSEVCRVAGAVGWAYPIAERLAGGAGGAPVGLVGGPGTHLLPHGDLDLGWRAIDLTGHFYEVERSGAGTLGGRLSPFVAPVELRRLEAVPDPALAARVLTLQSSWLLGLAQRGSTDTVTYTKERTAFGRRLADFQGLRFALADMAVAIQRSEELVKYTVWSLANHAPDEQLTDALALRVAVLETADTAMRGSHQLHGAMGFCDETDVSILSRLSQSVRRLPVGREELSDILARRMASGGFRGPFAAAAEPVGR